MTSDTRTAMNVPIPTAPMKTGRCTALRARAVNHACREIPRCENDGDSPVWRIMSRSLSRHRPRCHGVCQARKTRGQRPRVLTAIDRPALLDGDRALHVHCKVRGAVKLVLPRLHAAERYHIGFVWIHERRTHELGNLLVHVCIELRLAVSRDGRRVK